MKKFVIVTTLSLSLILTSCSPIKNISSSKSKDTNISTNSKDIESIKEFDKKSWKEFIDLYNNTEHIVNTLSSNDKLHMYNEFNKTEEHFKSKENIFDFGNTEEEKMYLADFSDLAKYGKNTCNNLKQYINSEQIKYLSDGKDNLEKCTEKITLIVLNREKFLKKAGYNESEIKEIINSDLKELNYGSNEIDDLNIDSIFDENTLKSVKEIENVDPEPNTANNETSNYFYFNSDYSDLIGTYKTVQAGKANVRSGPGFYYSIIDTAYRGNSVYIYDAEFADDRIWCNIGYGWISINTLNGLIR